MASKATIYLAFLLALNLLFFSFVSAVEDGKNCPKDALSLTVCGKLLGGLNVSTGKLSTTPCCSLIEGLADLEAAVCLCAALKDNVLGVNLDIPVPRHPPLASQFLQ